MSEYAEFVKEKEQIDSYFAEGFIVSSIRENLDGAVVEFTVSDVVGLNTIQIPLKTAEARKYIATRLLYKS